MFGPPKKMFSWGGGGDCSPAPPGSTPLGASDWTSKGGCVQWRIQDLQKKGVGGKIRARAPHTGGVQGAEPPEALEFSANKGLQDGRQE